MAFRKLGHYPLPSVIAFGIATDPVPTMLVLPVMYLLFGKGPESAAEDT